MTPTLAALVAELERDGSISPSAAKALISAIKSDSERVRREALEEAAIWCGEAAECWRKATTGEGGPVNRALRAMQYETTAQNILALKDKEPT